MKKEEPKSIGKAPKFFERVEDFEAYLRQYYYDSLKRLIEQSPIGLNTDEFITNVGNLIRENKTLLSCEHKSLLASVFMSAELGLRFSNKSNPEGLCFMLPYQNNQVSPAVKEAKFQIGYKGLIEIMRRVPQIENIFFSPVYENEFYVETTTEFKHIKYTGMDLNRMALIKATTDYLKSENFHPEEIKTYVDKYENKIKTSGKGELKLVWAAVKLRGIEQLEFESVTKDVLDQIQKKFGEKNRAYDDSVDVHNTMQVKAAIKKLFKKLPKTQTLSSAIKYDDALMAGKTFALDESSESIKIIDVDGAAPGDKKPKDFSAFYDESESFVQHKED